MQNETNASRTRSQTGPGGRSANLNVLTESMLKINGYGCWCYFDTDTIYKGKGEPVDPIDKICKYLIDGYMCAKHDAWVEEDPDCLPWEVDYNAGINLGSFYMDADPAALLVESCESKNPDSKCQQRACIVEGFLVLNIVDAFFTGERPLDQYRHSNGFDTSVCKTSRPTIEPPVFPPEIPDGNGNGFGDNNSEPTLPPMGNGKNFWGSESMHCCGNYPIRAPYRPDHSRGCCGTNTYNVLMFVCCNNFGVYEAKVTC